MNDVEIIIKIPKEVKNRLCFGVTYSKDIQTICEALNNDTQLSEKHGRIVDENKITKCEKIGIIIKDDNITQYIKTDAPTIIEANK